MALAAARLALGLALGASSLAGAEKQAPAFWPRYSGARVVELLDGQWEFGMREDQLFDSLAADFDPSDAGLTPNTTQVPSTLDITPPGYPGPRGVAMYRRRFTQSGKARLQFYGCSFYCRVFVDGQEIGEHRAGGYVPWWLDVPAPDADGVAEQERELLVLVDNRWNSTTAPTHTGGDFYMHGGIVRSVVLHDMPDQEGEVWVWRAYVLPWLEDPTKVNISLVLTDPSFSGQLGVGISFDSASPMFLQTVEASAGKAEIVGVSVPNPRLWSLEDPQLHTVSVTVNNATIIERFGLRSWGTDAATSRITLNGRIVKLYGWNHHTLWPDTGASPTDDQLDTDMQLLKEAAANYVRGAHYPQDPRWLDRLDEAGMAMWEETLGPSVSLQNTMDWGHFMKYQLQQLEEMLDSSMNHPSIMAWGFFNEGPSDQVQACPAYGACAELARKRDPTRFQTWASNQGLYDACIANASLISFNSYPAWYGHVHDLDYISTYWTQEFNGVQQIFPGKPFVVSETGAGGIYEWSDNTTDDQYTLNYQSEVVVRDVDVALSNSFVSGITLWHFYDFKADDSAQALCGPCDYLPGVTPPTCGFVDLSKCNSWRPGGLNHKGVVDFWRRKKPAFDLVAAMYRNVSNPTVVKASPVVDAMEFYA